MQKFVNVVIPPVNQPFIYSVSAELENKVRTGCQVIVPFGRRQARGFVVSESDSPESNGNSPSYDVKQIGANADVRQCFDARDLNFFNWVAEYYGESLSNIIELAIPAASREKLQKSVIVANKVEPKSIRSKIQREIYTYLCEQNEPLTFEILKKSFPTALPAIKKLKDAGLVKVEEKEIFDRHINDEEIPAWTKSAVNLNDSQLDALKLINQSIDEQNPKPILLHGITGSGKTEVYIEAIQHCLRQSRGALILVPEIALTPQLIDRFRARLGREIAILHSALNQTVRWDSWRALLEKRNFVAIGARSGIFAPVPNLGLIIVDEEHETSYKQSDRLRYNARDLAVMRGKFLNCPVVLGSATPSLETVYNALNKKYLYSLLPTRHEKNRRDYLKIEVVDLNKVKPRQMPAKNISPQLFAAIEEALAARGQVFILYNRRGFASYLQCDVCEEVIRCPHCSVTLTYHKKKNLLACHYCGLQQNPPQQCPACVQSGRKGSSELSQRGGGTEKVYEEIRQLFPTSKVDRLDRDTVANMESYRQILNRVRNRETDILVGTQMIAKGHDLPGVTLVGIVDCDVGLHFPDFRAAERTFQLLTQAAGRAGRGEEAGRVILQTRVPRHHSLSMTQSHSFMGFAKTELENRKISNYPPFTKLLRIVASSTQENEASVFLNHLKDHFNQILSADSSKFQILGPSAAPLTKLKDHWRYNMLIKSKSVTILNKIVRMAATAKAKTKKIKLVIDIDPQDML